MNAPYAVATVVWRQGPSSGKPGSRATITADGAVDGWIGGACAEPAVIRAAQEVMASGEPRLLFLGQPGLSLPEGVTFVPISCQSEGALQVYIEPVLPAPHLVVVGDSPMTRVLTACATALGWRTDDQPDEDSMVVVATQGHGDEEALEQALSARPSYVGLVASRRRGAAVLGYLTDRGVEGVDRVRVPAGLDLGATTHEEIAIAILAELVKLRAADSGRASMSHRGPATGLDESPRDPVCGMEVAGDAYTAARDGVTYHFCGAGCRGAFLESESRC
jgi:xanthine dehydrogenase accessory factor